MGKKNYRGSNEWIITVIGIIVFVSLFWGVPSLIEGDGFFEGIFINIKILIIIVLVVLAIYGIYHIRRHGF